MALAAILASGCGGDGSGPPPPPALAALHLVSGNEQAGVVGEALPEFLVVRAADEDGRPLPGITVTWAVETGGGSVTSSSRSDSTGAARARWTMGTAPGPAGVLASAGSRSASFTATAGPGLAALVQVVPATLTLEAGATRQLATVVKDAFGNDASGRPTGWTSLHPQFATVDAGGVVSAVAPGTAQVRATVEGQVGQGTVIVTGPPALQPTVSAITPELLIPGAVATATGTNFVATPGATTVTVNGAAAAVTVESATLLRFVVPPAAAVGCAPAGSVEVSVTVGGLSAKRSQLLRAGTVRTLAVGDTLHSAPGAPLECTELPGGAARYLVTVYNVGSAIGAGGGLAAGVGVQMRAASAPSGSGTAPFAAAAAPLRAAAAGPGSAYAARRAGQLRAHLALMERARLALPPARAPEPVFGRAAAARLQQLPNVGDSLWLRFPGSTSCTARDSLRARVVHVGPRAIVLEDIAAPLARQVDSMYLKLAAEFDTLQYGIVRDNFEDPLVLDPRTNADGRLYMLFTRRVNATGAAGFMWPGDLFARTECPQSNEAEIFYGMVPTVLSGGSGTDYTPAEWYFFSRATVIHEVKHIASVASRLSRGSSFAGDSVWLEEATAQAAEEIWARRLFGYAQRGNTGFQQSVGCELGDGPGCADKPLVMTNHFGFLWDFYAAPETHSILGRADGADGTIYGSAWAFLRWLTDQSALGESELFRRITQAQSAGVTTIQELTGRPFDQLLREFTLAAALDDRAGLTGIPGRYSQPSWQTRDIFRGLSEFFSDPSQPPLPEFPLNVRLVGAERIDTPPIRPGGAAFFELVVAGPARAFQLVDPLTGSALAATTPLRVSVIRIQ